MRTIRTTDGKWLQIDPKTDPWIFKTPHSSVRASLDYRQGEDLYLRTLPDGTQYYYVISWTDWQRESKEAYRIGLDPDILDRIEKYFPGLLKKRR